MPRSPVLRFARSLAGVLLCLAATVPAVAQAPGPESQPHAHASLGEMPATFPAGVRMLRDELAAIERARVAGNLNDIYQRVPRLAGLAMALPPLVEGGTTPTLLAGRGDVTRSTERLATLATHINDAGAAGDTAELRRAVANAYATWSDLDALVPKEYVCPMRCGGRTYDRPGQCPVCGMELQLVTSDRYTAQVTPRGALRAGRPVALTFRLRDPAGFDVGPLEVVHEKLLHLIVVSSDLSWFEHVHPVRDSSGAFHLDVAFPAGGRYTLYHDFTPPRVGMQVVPVELSVEGSAKPPTPLAIDDRVPKRIDGYDVVLTHTGLAPGLGCGFAFHLSRNGKPVTDLEPFLGTLGHLIIVSEDRGAFIHSHPVAATAGSGPIVEFGATFPKTGLYKAWGQFQRQGRVLTAPFTFRVTNDPHDGIPEAAAPVAR